MNSNKTSFQCQLAHGSPTVTIQDFSSLREMYKKIAERFNEIHAEDILFCTLNTYSVNMDHLATTNLGLEDLIFAHIKGKTKQVKFIKTKKLIGITLMVNQAGKIIIKSIRKDSEVSSIPELQPGDYIATINGESVVGIERAWEAANLLRKVPIGTAITMTLVEPLKSGFSFIAPRNPVMMQMISIDGSQTLRLRSDGVAELQEAPNKKIINRMNELFDSYLGFNDDELSLSVWETCRECKNFVEMGEMIRQTKLREFVFPEELVFDMWGIIDDWKNGLLEPQKEISEKEVTGGDVTKEGAGTSESFHHYWTSIETNVDEADLKKYERNSKPINDIEDVQNKD